MDISRETYCSCLFYSAAAFSRKLSRLADRAFAPAGVAASSAFILMAVNRQSGITAGQIARVMQISPSTVTRLVDRLEEGGYLRRRIEGKFILVCSTPRSERIDALLRKCWTDLNAAYSTALGEEEGRRLSAILNDAAGKLE